MAGRRRGGGLPNPARSVLTQGPWVLSRHHSLREKHHVFGGRCHRGGFFQGFFKIRCKSRNAGIRQAGLREERSVQADRASPKGLIQIRATGEGLKGLGRATWPGRISREKSWSSFLAHSYVSFDPIEVTVRSYTHFVSN
jgi:hypothetical protein